MDNKKKFEEYKGDYNKIEMNEEAYRKMRMRMDQAKAEKKAAEKRNRYRSLRGTAVAVAAALMIVILPNTSSAMAQTMGNIPVLGDFFKLVTVREFQHDDGSKSADVEFSEIASGSSDEDGASRKGEQSAKEINAEMKALINSWIDEFREELEIEGHENLTVRSEIIPSTEDYFTVKLIVCKAQGSAYEEHHYYTIDLRTGDRVELSDLFKPDTDYMSEIVNSIEAQMRMQMKADEDASYWIDDNEISGFNMSEAVDEAEFFINEDGNIVISFDECEVGPASMGVVEFVIEKDDIAEILK